MNKYTNQQLTCAEVIAELIEFAKEVAAEGNRGAHFTPALAWKELVFYDSCARRTSSPKHSVWSSSRWRAWRPRCSSRDTHLRVGSVRE